MSRCEGCPYPGERSCGSRGPLDADVVFVGEAPGRSEELAGEPFVGPTGQLLEEILERVLGGAQVYRLYTNAMACRPPEEKSPYLEGIVACRQRLLDEVNAHPRKLVVAMGNSAVRALTGLESPKISSLRGKLMTSDLVNAPVFPVFHPAAVLRQKSLFHTFADDLERAMGRVSGRRIRVRPGSTSHRVVSSMEEAEACALDMSEHGVVAVDIETTGLDKRLDRIIAVGLCVEAGRAAIVPAAYMRALAPLLEGRMEGKPRFLYHNGRFDAGFLRNNRIEARVDEDTLLLSYCLDEQPGRHGLKQLSNDILGAPDYELPLQAYKKEHNIVGDYSQIPEHILFPYLAMDVDYTLQLYHELMPAVFGVPALRALYQQLLIPASDLLTEVERTGFWVDPLRIEVAREVLTERKVLAADRLAELARRHWVFDVYKQWLNPESWERGRVARVARESKRGELVAKRLAQQEEIDRKNKHRSERFDARRASSKQADAVRPPRMLKPAASPPAPLPEPYAPEFNPGSPQQVRWMLKQWDIEVESTDSKTLEPFQEDSTFVQWLLSYRHASKLISTYVEGITRAIAGDGRVHSNFNLTSTVTGRLSSSDPNCQNVPRDPLIRGIFGAPHGRMLVEADFASAELRVLAHLSQDPFLAGVYDSGRDLHNEFARAAFGEEFTPEQRTQAKTCFSGDTELLTDAGWVRFDTYDGVAPVAQYALPEGFVYNPPNGHGNRWGQPSMASPKWDGRGGEVSFVRPDDFRMFPQRRVIHQEDRSSDMLITPDHDVIFVDGNRRPCKMPAEGLTAGNTHHVIASGFYAHQSDLDEAWTRVLAMVVSDGSFKSSSGVRLGFSRPRKIARCAELLEKAGIAYTRHVVESAGVVTFYFGGKGSDAREKLLTYVSVDKDLHWSCLHRIDGAVYLDEAGRWDGHALPESRNGLRYLFACMRKQTIEVMQAMAATHGAPSVARLTPETGCWQLSYRVGGSPLVRCSWGPAEVKEKIDVFCVQVPSGAIIVRRNGKVVVSSNCNFGIAYGMSGFALAKQLKIAVSEAERIIETWYERMPVAKVYLEACKQAPRDGLVIVTPFGRHRRYGLIDDENVEAIGRESMNFAIQSVASDLTLISAILLREPLADMGAKIVNIVHDSILVECDDNPDTIKQVATAMLATMRRVPAVALQTAIPFDADAKYGSHWGVDTTKFKEGA